MQFQYVNDPPVEVYDNVYIGSVDSAATPHCCDFVISMIDREPAYKPGFTPPPTMKFPMRDTDITADTLPGFVFTFNEALSALKIARGRGRKVLVHCMAGVNRSATLIGLYMIDCGMSPERVITMLAAANKKRKGGAQPALTNLDFRRLITARYVVLRQKAQLNHISGGSSGSAIPPVPQ